MESSSQNALTITRIVHATGKLLILITIIRHLNTKYLQMLQELDINWILFFQVSCACISKDQETKIKTVIRLQIFLS